MATIFGPLFSTADIDAHVTRLVEVFGMEVESRGLVRGSEVAVLRTPGSGAGAVVCRPDPPPAEQVREERTRLHRDALRVVDFYTPDLDAAVRHAGERGFPAVAAQAGYELAEGAFREAHLPGPDGTVTAFLAGPADFFAGFARVRDRVVSEVCSISLPVGDAAPSLDFYAEVFGWDVVFECAFEASSFAEMVGSGSAEHTAITSRSVGSARDRPYLNLVDYGLPAGAEGSLRGRSGMGPGGVDRRGLIGVVVTTPDLDGLRARAGSHPDAGAGEVFDTELPAFGRIRAALVTSPHGILHVVVEEA